MAPSSTVKEPTVPATLLPTSIPAQTRYLHNTQQAYLRRLYTHKVLLTVAQHEQDSKSVRSRRARNRRNRRNSTPEGKSDWEETEPGDGIEGQYPKAPVFGGGSGLTGWSATTSATSNKKRKLPAAGGSKSGEASPTVGEGAGGDTNGLVKEEEEPNPKIDPCHVYKLVYDLTPAGSSDSYYHGPHPAPPAKVIKSLLKASRTPPFFDPQGLSSSQLQLVTKELWDKEGGPPSHTNNNHLNSNTAPKGMMMTTGSSMGLMGTQDPDEDEWEADVISAFSTVCAGKIAKSLARMPPSMRTAYSPPPPPSGAAAQSSSTSAGLPPAPPPSQGSVTGGTVQGQGQGQGQGHGRQQSPFVEGGAQGQAQQQEPRYPAAQSYWKQW
ncbi:hypothetical protein T439DRAFT_329023 [Meredithblackwellia eburnea MCA 4105]